MSEGEQFISEFLKNESIEYRREEVIEKLRNDSKNFRVADFYLPKYKVYIEYFGQWNVESQKERYREKRQCYIDNKIPCIILYPENLGIIQFIFHKRLTYILERYKLEKELRNYRLKLFKDERRDNIILLIIGISFLYFALPWSSPENQTLLLIGFAIVGYQSYRIITSLINISKGKDPVDSNFFET